MANRYPLLLLLLFGLAGCVPSPPKQDTPPPQPVTAATATATVAPSLAAMLACLSVNNTLTPEQIRPLRATLEQQLPGMSISDQFRLACLLGRNNAKDSELTEALQLLESLQQEPELDTEQRQLIVLFQSNLVLIQRLRQQRRETREYQSKIEKLKGLEEELEPETVRQEPEL